MSRPAVSVVIRSFRGAGRLPRTLASLEGTAVPGDFEVLVVDDGSDDGTGAAVAAFVGRLPLRMISHPENRGRAAAANTGIREAAGRIVLILDDDMEAGCQLVRRHFEAHGGPMRLGAIGRIEQEGLDPEDPFLCFLQKEEASRRLRLLECGEIGFGDVWTGQFSVARDAAIEVGLLDEAIRAYGLEDVEFAYRLSRAGVRFMYLDSAVSRHAAFVESLERYCSRHASVGEVAAYLARRHDTPEMRRYLRLEPAPREARRSAFLRLMDASASLLRVPGAAALMASPLVWPPLRAAVRTLEAANVPRPLAFAYSFLRDIQYFRALRRGLPQQTASHGDRS